MSQVKNFFVNCALKIFVVLIYVVSHVYDYVSYPIYMIYYHPWRVRRYKKANHARKEEREDCVIYHSIQVTANYFFLFFAKNDFSRMYCWPGNFEAELAD
jgi:hypothetical protein